MLLGGIAAIALLILSELVFARVLRAIWLKHFPELRDPHITWRYGGWFLGTTRPHRPHRWGHRSGIIKHGKMADDDAKLQLLQQMEALRSRIDAVGQRHREAVDSLMADVEPHIEAIRAERQRQHKAMASLLSEQRDLFSQANALRVSPRAVAKALFPRPKRRLLRRSRPRK